MNTYGFSPNLLEYLKSISPSEIFPKNLGTDLGEIITKTLAKQGFHYGFMLIAGIEPATSSLPWMRSAN